MMLQKQGQKYKNMDFLKTLKLSVLHKKSDKLF
jgi:hypothetical protein